MVTVPGDLSAIVDGLNIDAADVTLPISQIKAFLKDVLEGVQAFERISFGTAEALTINAGGAISPSQTHIVVDTFASAATDNLDTINNGLQGRLLYLRIANASRQVVIRHNGGGSGNIRTATGQDYTITDTNTWVILGHNGSVWSAMVMPTNEYLNLGSASILTISSGAVTKTRNRHYISNEAAAATDDLDTISGGVVGDVLELMATDTTKATRIRHLTGNIRLANGIHQFLDFTNPLKLTFDGSTWNQELPLPYILSPSLRRRVTAQASGASPFIEVAGAPAATVTGTGSASNSADSVYSNFVQAAATINTFAGFASAAFNIARRSHNPRFGCILRTGPNAADITPIRFWIGLTSATVATLTDTLATSFIGFRWGTTAPDAGWIGIVSDGTNQSVTAALSAAITVDTVYKLEFRVDNSNGIVYFKVNDSAEVSLSSNLPLAATELGYHARQITLAAATKNFKVSRLWVETD